MLRFGAPECFDFAIRRWDRFSTVPSNPADHAKKRSDRIFSAINDEWNRISEAVDWDVRAAVRILQFILPATDYWLVDQSRYGRSNNGQQYVSEERYWARAINEAIGPDQVRDQQVVGDITKWLNAPQTSSELVKNLTSNPKYCARWGYFAARFFGMQREETFKLCEQVIERLLSEHGYAAGPRNSGFECLVSFTSQYLSGDARNLSWLEDRISSVAVFSLAMLDGLWRFFVTQRHFLRDEDQQAVRSYLIETLREQISDADALIARLATDDPFILFRLVFDPRNELKCQTDARSWSWLGPIVLEAVNRRNTAVATNCARLLGNSVNASNVIAVDREVLRELFGNDAPALIDRLADLKDEVPEIERTPMANVIVAAKQYFVETSLPHAISGYDGIESLS